MSNLSELLPAGGAAKEFEAVASGTLANGQTVVLNSNGTVEAVEQSTTSVVQDYLAGSATGTNEGQYNEGAMVAFDSGDSNKYIFVYSDLTDSRKIKGYVGTISGSGGSTSISIGPTQTILSGNYYVKGLAASPSSSGKFFIAYVDGNTATGYGAIISLSGTSLSAGTPVAYETSGMTATNTNTEVCADPNVANQFLIVDAQGSARVATVSGTTITYGTKVTYGSGTAEPAVFASVKDSGKFVVIYRDTNNSYYGTAQTLSLSGTTITAHTKVAYVSSDPTGGSNIGAFNPDVSGQFLVFFGGYLNGVNANRQWQGKVGTLDTASGSLSFSASSVGAGFNGENAGYGSICAVGGKTNQFLASYYTSNGSNALDVMQQVATISSGVVAFSARNVTITGSTYQSITVANDPNNFGRCVTGFNMYSGTPYERSFITEVGGSYLATNLTTTNFIGITQEAIADTATGLVTPQGGVNSSANVPAELSFGSASVFESATTNYISAVYDPNSNKIVIAYEDSGNSSYGTAVVGTVSGTSISFGTPVVFESAITQWPFATFDSTNNKVVIAYRDYANSNYGTAIVGTVSGTSISFGSAAVFENAAIGNTLSATYDSTNQKVVIAYRDAGNSNYGTAIVGTVSGTSISFGAAAVFESAACDYFSATFDSSANKVVIAYRDEDNADYGTAVVGTVSGTSISFGTPVVFADSFSFHFSATYDSTNQKVVIVYRDLGNSSYGTAVVGTVSGTSISFGTPVVFETASSDYNSAIFDPNNNKIVIAYQDSGNSGYGTAIIGTVSGTSISFGTAKIFEPATSTFISTTYDSTSQKIVIAYKDGGNSNYGTSLVSSISFSLATGSDYYVQDDGTLSTTVSSVPAGRALSTTSILLEG